MRPKVSTHRVVAARAIRVLLCMPAIAQFIGALLFSLASPGVALAQGSVPLIDQPLVPDAVKPGGPAFTLTVNGTGFVPGAIVNWNGSARATTFVSESQLTAAVHAWDVTTPGTASVSVVNPGQGGGISNVAFFEVTSPSSAIGLRSSEFGTGQNAVFVSVGDLNGDGKADLAVAECYGNVVMVLLGNGDGTFPQFGMNNPVGMCPASVALADFNRDGKLDMAVTNIDSNDVSVLLGNGNGTFQSAVNYAVPEGPISVAVGDFNRDGKLDLAVALNKVNGTATGTAVSVLLGNGDGTFQPAVTYNTGTAPSSVAVADFNHDGKLDLAVSNQGSDDVSVLLGNGDGTFQVAVNYATASGPSSVAIGDFNHDGKLDLAVSTDAGAASVLLGNGDGTFQPHVDYQAGGFPASIAVADLNGDNNVDLAVADFQRFVQVLLGNGDGTFQAPVSYGIVGSPSSVAIGDFNGDGRLDIAVPDYANGAATVLLQMLTGVYLTQPSLMFGMVPLGGSKTLSTTLINLDSTTLSINAMQVTGSDKDEFSQVNTCGSSVPAGHSCTISVTFKPTEAGADSSAVSISDNGPGSPQQVSLSGAGCVFYPLRHICLQ